jgi:hypothetical protein
LAWLSEVPISVKDPLGAATTERGGMPANRTYTIEVKAATVFGKRAAFVRTYL